MIIQLIVLVLQFCTIGLVIRQNLLFRYRRKILNELRLALKLEGLSEEHVGQALLTYQNRFDYVTSIDTKKVVFKFWKPFSFFTTEKLYSEYRIMIVVLKFQVVKVFNTCHQLL